MNLGEILLSATELNEDEVVYAKRPWSFSSEACIFHRRSSVENSESPAKGTGFEYFLEAFLILEIYEDLMSQGKTNLQAAEIILYYGENDAYPE